MAVQCDCDCAYVYPRDEEDPRAYPGPNPDCDCECHDPAALVWLCPDCTCCFEDNCYSGLSVCPCTEPFS